MVSGEALETTPSESGSITDSIGLEVDSTVGQCR
jgi:hypothetical protein